eukprot:2571908-Prymnesium_polylepis.2
MHQHTLAAPVDRVRQPHRLRRAHRLKDCGRGRDVVREDSGEQLAADALFLIVGHTLGEAGKVRATRLRRRKGDKEHEQRREQPRRHGALATIDSTRR